MSDIYNFITSDDPRTGALTASQLQARRAIAAALATRNRPYPKTIGEGLTAFGEGLGEGLYNSRLDRAEAIQRQADAEAMKGPAGAATGVAPRPAPGGASLEGGDQATQAYAMVPPDATAEVQPSSVVAQAPQQSLPWKQIPEKADMTVEEFNQRTARNESGGEKDPYRAVGREVNRRGDRGYGKYMVMGENIPVWSKQYLGREMTPQEFLLDDKAQDQLAKAKGGEYLAKYGPNGAAAAWFAGETGSQNASRPNLQAHIADYVTRFNRPSPEEERNQVAASAAGGNRPIQLASLGGVPTSDTAPDPTRDAVAQTLTGPPPQQVAQAQPLPQPAPVQATPYAGAQGVEPAPASAPGIRPVPQVPNYPAIGPEPTRTSVIPPQVAAEMQHWERVKGNPNVSAAVHDFAKDKFDKLQSQMNDEYTKQWTHWRTEADKRVQHEVERPQKQLTLEQGTLGAEKTRQEIEENKSKEALRKQYGNLSQTEVEKRVGDSKDSADKAVLAYTSVRNARAGLDSGDIITGFGANQRLDWAKLNKLMGFEDKGNEIANTEVFRSSMAPAVASMLKATVGTTQISNTDRQFAEKAAGGDITLDTNTMKRLLDISHRLSLETMAKHQYTMDTIYKDNPQAQALLGINPPAPQHHVERLLQNKDNPEYIKDFDTKYYRGAARTIINRGY